LVGDSEEDAAVTIFTRTTAARDEDENFVEDKQGRAHDKHAGRTYALG
jgi:hypothetical protein